MHWSRLGPGLLLSVIVGVPSSGTLAPIPVARVFSASSVPVLVQASRTTSTLPALPPAFRLANLACPTANTCFAVGGTARPGDPNARGQIVETADGGATWTTLFLPDVAAGIACFSTSRCTAFGSFIEGDSEAGTALATTLDGGRTWSQLSTRAYSLHALVCPASTVCYGMGEGLDPTAGYPLAISESAVVAITHGGRSWHFVHKGSMRHIMITFACPTRLVCYGGYGTESGKRKVIRTTDGGKTWRQQSSVSIAALSCPGTHVCYALSIGPEAVEPPVVIGTTDGATSWSALLHPRRDQPLLRLTCPTATTCYALTSTGVVLLTRDGGTTWTEEDISQAVHVSGEFDLITCPDTQTCYVAGMVAGNPGAGNPDPTSFLLRTADGGRTWQDL